MSERAPAGRIQVLDINLLPRNQRPAEVPPLGIVIALLLLIGFAATVPLAFKAESARSRAQQVEDQAQQAEADLRGVNVELAQRRALTSQIDDAKMQLAALRRQRSLLQGGTRPLSADLAMLWGAGFLPPGARITAVTATDKGFRVDGIAPDPLAAIAYAGKLASDGGFMSASLASFAPAAKDGGQFSIEVAR